MPPHDFRSDLLTRPSPAMQAAMQAACMRPWSFDLREDEDQRALESDLAALLGQEDALLMPTATMANEIALMLLARPGQVVVAPADVHVATSEAGAPAALAGVTLRLLDGHEPTAAAWDAALAPAADALRARVGAILVENTHNRAGGAAISAAACDAALAAARRHGVGAHLDGARLFNAAVALDETPARLAAGFDTVCVSLNKGLGAPIGAALAGSRRLIAEALVLRQRLGGGIRPTAIFAAAARVALSDWRDLAEDHRRAAALAAGLDGLPGLQTLRPACPTNIVVVRTARELGRFLADLAARGVLALAFGPGRVRFVVHRDLTCDDIAAAIAACRDIAASSTGSEP